MPWMRAKPVTSVVPKRAFHSSKSLPSTMPRDDLARVVGLARVGGNEAVELFGGILRFCRNGAAASPDARRPASSRGRPRDDAARDAERMSIVLGEVIDDAGDPRVHFAAAELLGA